MKSKIISLSLLVIGFLVGASALSALAAWTTPNCDPATDPGACNTDAPLNVGPNIGGLLQSKLGGLSLNTNGLGAYGLEVVNGIKLIDTSVLAGTAQDKVLTADENGIGTWKSIDASESDIITCKVSTIPDSFSVSYGKKRIIFTESDCGGTLPDGSYNGVIKGTYVITQSGSYSGPIVNNDEGMSASSLLVLNTSEGGPGVDVSYGYSAFYPTLYIEVTYIKL